MKYSKCPKCTNSARMITEDIYRMVYRCETCRHVFEVSQPQGIKRLSFCAYDHQGKADYLTAALEVKYERRPTSEATNYFCLTDSDVSGRMVQMKKLQARNVRRFFIYPHAARPSLINSQYQTWAGTTAQFVVNEYHAEVLRGYGYEKPIETMGWHLSKVEPFKGRDTNERAVKVLFAPIHPRNAQQDRDANKATFDRLYKHVLTGEVELTVRYIGELQESGLTENHGVLYVNGQMNQATSDMENADVIVAHQTFAWLAVARGFPCVMFAEDMPTHFRVNSQYVDVACWKDVYHLFRYPLDLLCENDIIGLLRRAAKSDNEITDWRRRMIGEPFDPTLFVEKVEKYL